MIVIGLTGLMRAGKDTVADILVEQHGFTKMAFAAPLKRMVKNLDPIVGFRSTACCSDCYEEIEPVYLSDLYAAGMTDEEIKASEYGNEARRIWQRFGTDVMRAEQDDYWIQAAALEIKRSGADRVVFTDCRFPNESDFIYELSGYGTTSSVWQVVRPGVTLPEGAHVSEQWTGRLGEEVTLHNDGTIEELAESVKIAMDFLDSDKRMGGWVQTASIKDGNLDFEEVRTK